MRDDSYIQAMQEQEAQEFELLEKEHQEYLEVLAKGDEHGNN